MVEDIPERVLPSLSLVTEFSSDEEMREEEEEKEEEKAKSVEKMMMMKMMKRKKRRSRVMDRAERKRMEKERKRV